MGLYFSALHAVHFCQFSLRVSSRYFWIPAFKNVELDAGPSSCITRAPRPEGNAVRCRDIICGRTMHALGSGCRGPSSNAGCDARTAKDNGWWC